MAFFDTDLRSDFPEASKFFRPIEQARQDWELRFDRWEDWAHKEMETAYEVGGTTAQMLIASQLTCVASRVNSLVDAAIVVANQNNGAALPAVARALFETSCVPYYLAERVTPLVRKNRVAKLQRELYRLGLGTAADAGVGHIKPVSVGSLMRAGRAWLDAYAEAFVSDGGSDGKLPGRSGDGGPDVFTMIYGPLTDRTHPNYGAMSQSMDIETATGDVEFFRSVALDDESFDYTLACVWCSLLTAGEAGDAVAREAGGRVTPLPDAEPVWRPGETHTR